MSEESTGQGDADRTLALLWRHRLGDPQGSRGPRQKFSVDQVVNAAIALVDAEGIDALSMRNVANRLGTRVMSLYTYVPGKAELIDLMVDAVHLEVPVPATRPEGWRDRLEAVARDQWELYRKHPWLLQVDTSRPPLGPGISDRYEYQLGAVEGIGLSDLDMDSIVTLVGGFVAGAARSADAAQRLVESSATTDAQWWEVNAPILEQVMDGSRYPIAGRVGSSVGELFNAASNPQHAWEFGLARVLDGIEQYIEKVRQQT
ncbi:MAG: TetR/AcrR family transcriptional regulator C-terminal domain-containing protein [Homoserinimonas sp.]